MVKVPESAAGRLSALVAEIDATAYARGKADARKEVLAALEAATTLASRPRGNRAPLGCPAGKARTGAGRRAPRGTVRTLVERALRDQLASTPSEILDCAASDGERLVKLTSIRVELHAGPRQGRYESKGGRWSLAAPSSATNEDKPDAPASAPTGNGPGDNAEAGQPEIDGNQGRLGMNW